MKVVIDSNVIILAAIGSGTCSKVILLTIDNAQIMESKIVSIELQHFSKKLKNKNNFTAQKDKLKVSLKFFFFCIIKNTKKILDISTDKPNNHLLSLSFEENTIYITGDKQALESAKINNIRTDSPSDFKSNKY